MAAKVGKATAARRQAEAAAKAAGKSKVEIKEAGQTARVAADPRLKDPPWIPTNHGFGPNSGKGYVPRPPQVKKAAAPAAAAPAEAAPSAAPAPTYDPTPLTISGASEYSIPETKFPEIPAQQLSPGMAAGVDNNAAGFRRKKSSARLANLTSKGTGQFKIAGQTSRSSALNIGV
jgi:hypothetical protein